ncbi:LysR substrate-binding domain-containing protein [Marinovum sp. 2_MG-2023]|uniref:LysR family transcriptional regulator n=1 Tax=unclassified Marinovum TaxID=2647166 RepID=UPI0026E2B65C|nr:MULTISPECIES: LysR substrate-binding domain-containing protein [unclassified Marinovum]MDO6729163.1 LysR substrate-binding domain-containing protein [Marinovum sp. 2_MG-2023]MDO6779210.1 LysR substrate-binding domain-containing protein [Marinovum sp. 1_MG-2023]
MKPQHIQVLVAIAEHGSLRAAAKHLDKSQPALTQSLRQAEQELGVSVFSRTSRGVELTEIGERILVRARTIASEIERLDEEVAQLRGEQVGAVNVCLSPLAAMRIMPRALTLFRKTHPNIEVRLSSGLFPGAIKPLREGRIDLLIGPEPPIGMTRELTIEHLIDTPIQVVTSDSSPLLKARSLGELAEAQWIMIGAPTGPGDIFRQPFVDHGLTPPMALTTSESYFGALSLVESLGAVCTFPALLMDGVRRSWNIAPIPIREEIAPLKISLMSRAGHPLTPAADALAMCIRRRVTSL